MEQYYCLFVQKRTGDKWWLAQRQDESRSAFVKRCNDFAKEDYYMRLIKEAEY